MTDQTKPAVWIDGHPQLEAIAAAVWEKCGRSDSGGCVEDDPRNIAVAALAALLPPRADRAAALRDAAAIARVRTVLETEAVVGRSALDYRGLVMSALMDAEAQPAGAPPVVVLDLSETSARCPLCPHPVTLHTPNGARAHFAAVHPEQRVTGRPEACRTCRGSGLDPRYNGEFACPDCTAASAAPAAPDEEQPS
ncbi:hypothetical protein [Streptomyces sp. NPDC059786]|uniref:hypothetical protein n=1 Tax=Streptomyces sp. NPDC059786 TaxID=3346946 RepID=UPI003648275A